MQILLAPSCGWETFLVGGDGKLGFSGWVSRLKWKAIALCTLLLWPLPSSSSEVEHSLLLRTVKQYYFWVLKNGDAASHLEPRIKNVPGSTRFYLDTTTLQGFAEKLMDSNAFAPEFQNKVAGYYAKYAKEFEGFAQNEFDEYARNGRGPMMDVEDMDIYFCAQEYEYTPSFIDGMKVIDAKFRGSIATAVVESPYKWKTTFQFRKIKGQWLISSYCVYQ